MGLIDGSSVFLLVAAAVVALLIGNDAPGGIGQVRTGAGIDGEIHEDASAAPLPEDESPVID